MDERNISMMAREKAELIAKDIKKEWWINPVFNFKNIEKKEYLRIHAQNHYIINGASLLVAYENVGGKIDIWIYQALDRVMVEGFRMPRTKRDLWEICESVTSIGVTFAFRDGTGYLLIDGT